MQSSSRRSNPQTPFETSSYPSTLKRQTPKYLKNTNIKRPTISVLPRTSSIDAAWESPANETVETQPDSELPDSGIRQSNSAIENQTLRPGILPVFSSNVLILEADRNHQGTLNRFSSQRVVERILILSIGIVVGICLSMCIKPLVLQSTTRVGNDRSFASISLPIDKKPLKVASPSVKPIEVPRGQENPENSLNLRSSAPTTSALERSVIKPIEVPTNLADNPGLAPTVLSQKPLVGKLVKPQNPVLPRRPVLRRAKAVASDNPY